jgi:hypothetical protein
LTFLIKLLNTIAINENQYILSKNSLMFNNAYAIKKKIERASPPALSKGEGVSPFSFGEGARG